MRPSRSRAAAKGDAGPSSALGWPTRAASPGPRPGSSERLLDIGIDGKDRSTRRHRVAERALEAGGGNASEAIRHPRASTASSARWAVS